ncbi:MAG: methyl-accepting chemotaxis protein [Oscillospiraceae bacterium]|jgi:methyl-accepting chemotaxis protein|nr:methyl-accepting chemotaxis protein [Oscillospiraceae bacterium]
MRNLKVSKKLTIGFALAVILTAVVGAVGIISMDTLSRADEEMYQNNAKPMSNIAVLYDLLSTQRICAANMVIFLDSDPQFSLDEGVSLTEKEAAFVETLASYEGAISNDEEREIYSGLEALYFNDFAALKQAVRDAVGSKDKAAMTASIKALDSMGSEISGYLDEANSLNDSLAADKVAANKALSVQRTWILAAVMLAAAVFSVIMAVFISGIISKPLSAVTAFLKKAGESGDFTISEAERKALDAYAKYKDETGQTIAASASFIERVITVSKALEAVSGGDLTAEITPLSDRDILGTSVKKMTDNLNAMFGDINSSSVQVSAGAGQMADGAQALAAGSTEQAASIQQLSSSIAEINDMAKENTKNATDALNGVRHSEQLMNECMEFMRQMLEAMRVIDEKSHNIARTTKVIDDIAFQTNILALNAAVEAARAGQHGKGFAVVAEEVRNLAGKSAEAASETSALIESSYQSVNEGNRIVERVNASLQAVAETSHKNAAQIEGVQAVSVQQGEAMAQINVGIDQVARVVQQNTATAEESAAASEEMSGQSAMLQRLISQFRLRGESAGRGETPTSASNRSAAPEATGMSLSAVR